MLRLSRISNAVRTVLVCVAIAGLGLAISSTAHAGHHPHGPSFRSVVTYETRQEAYPATVVKYDHCGRAYLATVTRFRTVQVPVRRFVPIYNRY